MRVAPLPFVRHTIARALLGPDDAASVAQGSIVLRPHQRAAVARLVELIRRNGGALLAEPVGVGKTYTAIAVAEALNGDVMIVAPASLRAMWEEALAVCDAHASLITHEALSRGTPLPHRPTVIVIDEAHRFRVSTTRRYGLVAELCRHASVLLVSATPVQNRRQDLAALLALFLGRRAFGLTDEQLAGYVVRGLSDVNHELPRLVGPTRVTTTPVDDCLDELLRLPPPVPAKDESLPATLLMIGLLHQWSSSRAALVAALKRRRARALAMLAAVEGGARPTRAELSAWTYSSDALQLAFPALVVADNEPLSFDVDELRRSLEAHHQATGALLRSIDRAPNPDDGRAAWLHDLCRTHTGERIIAFCHYEETVNALWTRLSRHPGLAALTAKGARVAGGSVTRGVVLRQFTPGAAPAPVSEQIQLLLTTDLLSEGLNLQEASVVVHLDYPWNPARLDQRVGRIRRIGSRHEHVTVYAMAPPAPVEKLLRLETRLNAKLRVANRTIGVAGHILPAWTAASISERGMADSDGVLRRHLATWLDDARSAIEQERAQPIVAAARTAVDGFLALVIDGSSPLLVITVGDDLNTSPEHLLDGVRRAEASSAEPDLALAAAARDRVEVWLANRRASASIDLTSAASSRTRRLALTRVAHALSRAPRHRQMLLAPLAAAARAVATASLPEGAERVLDALVGADLPDEAWLRSVVTFGELNARHPPRDLRADGDAVVAAIILFQRE